MRSTKIEKIIFLFMVVCLFASLLTFNFLTPYASDDFAHYFGVFGEHPTSFKGIIDNLKVFRNTVNGRVIAHFFVYSFLTMPKWIFNIVNAAVATLLPLLIIRYCNFETPKVKMFIFLLCISMLWVFIQSFGQVFLWLTGSCNYLWGLCLFVTLIYPFYCEYIGRECSDNTVLLCICAFFAGAYSECGSAATGLTIGSFTILLWIKNKKFPIKNLIICLFALVGFIFLMLAPATDTRTGADYMRNIWFIRVCLKDYSLILIIIYASMLIMSIVFKINKRIIIASIIISVSGFFSILTFIFAAYLPARSFFVLNTFLILSILVLLSNLYQTRIKLVVPVLTVLMFAIFLVRGVPGVKDIYNIYSISQERMLIATEQQGRDVELKAYSADTMYPAVTEEELSEDSGDWYNDLVAKYYGFRSVRKMK